MLGGETAEHPGVMPEDQFDMAGFCVGSVDEADLLGPHRVHEGDVLIGLTSTGLHANGYSLVRSALLPGFDLAETPDGLARPLADELLEPCRIDAPIVMALSRDGQLHAAAHITGGGLLREHPARAAAGPWGHRRARCLARAADVLARAEGAGRIR